MPRAKRSLSRSEIKKVGPVGELEIPAVSAGLSPGSERDAIIVAHRPLVRATARRYVRSGISLDDLESEGFLGLMEAARRFDPSRGTTFGSYASWWVRVFIERFAMANRRIVTTPQTRAIRRLAQIRRVEREVEQQTGDAAGDDDIATRVRLRAEQVREARTLMTRRDVATRAAGHEGWEPRDDEPTPEEQAAEHEWEVVCREQTRSALALLDRRERTIIESRILREEAVTLESLGARFGVTRERVRQIEARALEKMRDAVAC